jgi:hypothetical protein
MSVPILPLPVQCVTKIIIFMNLHVEPHVRRNTSQMKLHGHVCCVRIIVLS